MSFVFLFWFVSTLINAVLANPVTRALYMNESPSFLMSEAQLTHWLSVTNASLTFVGDDPDVSNPLTRRAAQTTTVTYCTKRVGNTCGGECTVYKGGAACVDTSKIQCLAANKNVGFCDKKGCDGNCRTLFACGTFLEDGFCYAAETQSIVISTL